MLKEKAPRMLGETKTVEVDETYIGDLEKNRHYSKKRSEVTTAMHTSARELYWV